MDFVLTSDLDWASEFAIDHFLSIAGEFSIKPTLFVTHGSPAAEAAAREGRAELAAHPNFLAGSTHGNSIDAVAEHVLRLVPEAVAWRCHRYCDNTAIRAAMSSRGLRVDSNVCQHLAPAIAPQYLAGGTLRLPVFFEDDVHWGIGGSWRFADTAAAFTTPGIKILNFHPFFVALNIADASSYARLKPNIGSLTKAEAAAWRNPEEGAATFLQEMLRGLVAAGHRFITLSELAEKYPVVGDPARPGATPALATACAGNA